jgi:transcriptional regulator with XRE-family HTH domain
LGQILRRPRRIGRPVTQEELAEAAGISGRWYAMMESNNRARHISSSVLSRVAQTLMLDAGERASLYALSVPEFELRAVDRKAQAILDAFGSLRPVMKRLWSATNEIDGLRAVTEYSAKLLDGPDLVVFCERQDVGNWDLTILRSNADAASRCETILSSCGSALTPAQVDDLMSFGLVNEPGQVAVRSELRYSQQIEKPFREALTQVRWTNMDVLISHVRTRRGFEGQLSVVHSNGRLYSESERAIFGTLTTLVSLALS